VLALDAFAGGQPDDEAEAADFEAASAWRELQGRLELGAVEPATAAAAQAAPAVAAARPARPAPLSRRPLYLLAATLAAATLGLSFWVGMLRGELARLRQPQLNLPIVNLEPVGMRRGGAETVTVGGNAERFVLILNPPQLPPHLPHRVEILDTDGRLVWEGRGLEPTPLGNFHLELSRRLLPASQYRLRLLRDDDEVAEFTLQLTGS
jgi:hypothetical protein